MTDSATSSATSAIDFGDFSHRLIASALVVNPLSRQVKLNKREEQDDCEKNPGQRGRVAHSEVLEGVPVYPQHVEQSGVDRPPSRGYEGRGEDLK